MRRISILCVVILLLAIHVAQAGSILGWRPGGGSGGGATTAANVSISDVDGYYTGANVELALDEVGEKTDWFVPITHMHRWGMVFDGDDTIAGATDIAVGGALKSGSTYYLIYNSNTAPVGQSRVWSIGLATSSDKRTWTDQGIVITAPSGYDWIFAQDVIEKDGVFYLFAAGPLTSPTDAEANPKIYYTSTDMYNWTYGGVYMRTTDLGLPNYCGNSAVVYGEDGYWYMTNSNIPDEAQVWKAKITMLRTTDANFPTGWEVVGDVLDADDPKWAAAGFNTFFDSKIFKLADYWIIYIGNTAEPGQLDSPPNFDGPTGRYFYAKNVTGPYHALAKSLVQKTSIMRDLAGRSAHIVEGDELYSYVDINFDFDGRVRIDAYTNTISLDNLEMEPPTNSVLVWGDNGATASSVSWDASIGGFSLLSESTSGSRGITLSQHNDDIHGAIISGKKGRGTEAAPTAPFSGDYVFTLLPKAYDGSAYQLPAQAGFQIDSAVTSGSTPTRFFVNTGTSAGGVERFSIGSDGGVTIGNDSSLFSTGTGLYVQRAWSDTGSDNILLDLTSHGDASRTVVVRSNGTPSARSALISNNVIGSLEFKGYDGSAFSAEQAGISVVAAENWSTAAHGTTMKFYITPPGSIANTEKMELKSDGLYVYGGAVIGESATQYSTGIGLYVRRVWSDTGSDNILLDLMSHGDASRTVVVRSNGTPSARSALISNNVIGSLEFKGYDGAAFSAEQAGISVVAAENWGTAAHGTKMQFYITMPGTTVNTRVAELNLSGMQLYSESTSGRRGITLSQHNDDIHGAIISGKKGRGTEASPAATISGDYVLTLLPKAYDGSAYQLPAQAGFQIDSAVATGSTPTRFFVNTGTSAGGVERFSIGSDGGVTINNLAGTGTRYVCVNDAGTLVICP